MADEFTTLHEFDMCSAGVITQTLKKSFEGVRTPSADYEEQLLTVGPITRAIGPFNQGYSLGSVRLSLHNTSREYSILGEGRFIGRDHRLKFGNVDDGLAAARQIFAGRTVDYSIGNGVCSFDCRDTGADRFYNPVRVFAKTVTASVFPDLPAGEPEVLANIIYGDISTNGGNMFGAGPVPCRLIDADAGGKWRYLVSQHVCKSVDVVYVYGEVFGAGRTITTASYAGITMQVIDFNADPRDPDRPNEIEVTVLVKGITDNGTSGGTLITNPVEQRDHFLQNFAGWDSSEIDSSLSTIAAAAGDDNILGGSSAPYSTAWIVTGDIQTRVIDILNKLTDGVLLYTWMTTENRVGAFLLTLTEATTAHVPAFSVSDGGEILRGSFSVTGNRGGVYSGIDYQRVYNWTLDRYAVTAQDATAMPIRRTAPFVHTSRTAPVRHTSRTAPLPYSTSSSASSRIVGDTDTPDAPSRLVSLECVADPNTAISVATVYGLFADGRVQFATFDLPPEYILNDAADLNGYVGVTHWQGISAEGGYDEAVFRIVRTEASVQPKSKKLRLMCMKLAS